MSHKRPLSVATPLPIFNKGKRPRQALIAHPNNQGGILHEPSGLKGQHYDEISFRSGTSNRGQENLTPNLGWTNVQQQQQQPKFAKQKSSNFNPYKPHNSQPKLNSTPNYFHQNEQSGLSLQQKELLPTAGASTSFRKYTIDLGPTAMGNATALADEPTQTANIDRAQSRGQSSRQRRRQLRVLTATAQGIEHWSQYKQHTQLLFEVYGILASIAKPSNHIQTFRMRTADGPLNCIFWEMEQPFPTTLTQGQGVRVVGEWDTHHKRLKCFTVRAALKGEEGMAEKCVMAADAHMRRLVQGL